MQSWQLLAASKNITIHGPDSDAGHPIAQYNPHRGIVNCAVYNHTSKVIASCGQDGKISLHNALKCQDQLLQITYHTSQEDPSSINCCLFSPKSKYIAAGSVNSSVKVWDMKSNKEKQALHKLKGHVGAVTSVGWINNQQIIATSSTSGDILLHDVTTGVIRDSLTSRLQEGINNIKVSEGQGYRRLGACTNSGSLMVWDVNISTKKPISTYHDPKKASFTCLSISSFNPVLMVCGSIDSSFLFMDINERKVIKTVATEEPLTSIAFNEDGQLLAAGGISGGLMIYDLRKVQSPLFRLNGHDTPIKSICFSEKQKNKQISLVEDQDRINKPSPSISTYKLQPEDKASRPVKNLTKKEESRIDIPQSKSNTRIEQKQPTSKAQLTTNPSTIPSSYSSSINPIRPATSGTIQSSYTVSLPPEGIPLLKTLEDKIFDRMNEMEERMNNNFELLHLQVIRQMQHSVQRISQNFDKKIGIQKQLENKIKALQQENSNLKKMSF